MTSIQKLELWLQENPDDYFTKSLNKIADEIGIPFSAVQRNLHIMIAEREGMLPSEVKKGRQHQRGGSIDRKQVVELRGAGKSIDDIAFMLGCGTENIRRILRENHA